MREIGIRELKAKASELVRHVAEDHAVYPVGVLAPADFAAAKGRGWRSGGMGAAPGHRRPHGEAAGTAQVGA